MEKTPTINLTDLRYMGNEGPEHFRVKSMKNTITYQVGNCLSETDVQNLIDMEWTVNIVDKA